MLELTRSGLELLERRVLDLLLAEPLLKSGIATIDIRII